MMRSLFAGVSGLQNHQVRMDVIGNNIANVNTVGFKYSRATFKEALSQTLAAASAPQGNRGGVNAQQVGLGSRLGSIDVIHTQGGTQSSSSETDLAIEGNGFFILVDGDKRYYTRAGMFEFDGTGTLTSKLNGLPVLGYLPDATGNISSNTTQLMKIQITEDVRSITPQATTEVVLSGNISSALNDGESVVRIATVYDVNGDTHRVLITFTKTGLNNWSWTARLETDDPSESRGDGTIEFNDNGTISAGHTGTVTIPAGALPLVESTDLVFTLDFNGVRQFADETSVAVLRQDGLPKGELDGISIDRSGTLIGSYSNGLIKELGRIALARFENPPGLLKVGDTMFAESVNSGDAVIGMANTSGLGAIMSNSLEMSNVDLSNEFTEMIITQRGFQANSRIITSADEMLQELVNLKR
ncbi:MAG TPA: flagellar hook protein FlgE [Limnochordia bacterium]|nr:flagellar hook protein FlgE [Limnochordia bacterium]HPZ29831.1 flagellar hook protein FlgE [Limnochordia bacterium]HQD71518.1 flagellar hook protein FlgE [Limnochordia bacterium]